MLVNTGYTLPRDLIASTINVKHIVYGYPRT